MAGNAASLLVAVSEKRVCFRLSGRPSFNTSLDFKAVVAPLQARGHSQFVLDLTECVAMDSTFLGVLAGFAQRLAESGIPGAEIELLNPKPQVTEFLENLEVLNFFKVSQRQPGADCKFQAVAQQSATKADLARVCLEAHQTLMELSPGNVARFKDVVRFMAEDLKQEEKKPQ